MGKKSGVIYKPPSNTIVDLNYYKETGFIAKLVNKYHTNNALGEATRNF